MAALPLPNYEQTPTNVAYEITAPLLEAGWRRSQASVGDTVYLNAWRSDELPDVDPGSLSERLTLPRRQLNAAEELRVESTKPESMHRGRTFVHYRGRDLDYLGYIVTGMVEFGEKAGTPASIAESHSRRGAVTALGNSLRAHLPLEIGGSVAAFGIGYALLARHKR